MNNYPFSIRSKLPQVGTTIFTVMSALANEHQAINLSQGFPDFEVDKNLIDLIHAEYQAGKNQYAPMPGVKELREAIAEKYSNSYGVAIDPDLEVTVTPGATTAIFSAITAVVHPDDEVLIFEPAYDCYAPAITLCGGVPVYIELKAPDFTIDWEVVKKRINHKTRMIIINTPHNPTGSIISDKDMRQLEKLVLTTDILILSDEVYEHILFDEQAHQSVLRFPKLAERSFAVYSFGKTFHATGWKLGYVIAPEALTKEFRKVHQFNVFSTNTPVQYALAKYLKTPEHYLGLNAFYEEKRNYFLNLIKDLPFIYTPTRGSYFQLLDYSKISDEKDMDYAKRLTKEIGVATVPLSAFYHRAKDYHLLRFCFAKKQETLDRAVERLLKLN